MASPRPAPPVWRPRDGSSRSNGAVSLTRASGGTPGPSSSTVTLTVSPSRQVRSLARVAGGNLVFGVLNGAAIGAIFTTVWAVPPVRWPLADWRTWAAGFLAVELAYYWFHRFSYDAAFGSDPAYWAKASPMDQWTPAAVPMMFVCSTQRPDAPCDDAERFRALAAKAGKTLPVLPQNLSHAEINRTLGLPSPYTASVNAFIAARLGGGY